MKQWAEKKRRKGRKRRKEEGGRDQGSVRSPRILGGIQDDSVKGHETHLLPQIHQKYIYRGNSLEVQWLGLRTLNAEGPGSIPDQGTKIPQAVQYGQN